MFIEVSSPDRNQTVGHTGLDTSCLHKDRCSGCLFDQDLYTMFRRAQAFFSSCGVDTFSIIEMLSTHFRTRAKLAVRKCGKKVNIGLFIKGSHLVLPIPSCVHHHPAINAVVHMLQMLSADMAYDERSHSGIIRYIQVLVEKKTGCAQVTFVLHSEPHTKEAEEIALLGKELHAKYPDLFSSIYLNFQAKNTNTIFGSDFEHVAGRTYLLEEILGVKIPLFPHHFFQANLSMFEKALSDIVLQVNENDVIAELYAGMGVMSLALSPFIKKSVAVERSLGSKQAFLFAKKFLPQEMEDRVDFIESDVERFSIEQFQANCVLVDPPRKGLSEKTVSFLIEHEEIQKIIYLSCHFPSLEHNIRSFIQSSFSISFAKAYRFFPGTDHIETLVVLQRR